MNDTDIERPAITTLVVHELVCSSCRNTQLDPEVAVIEPTQAAVIVTGRALGWSIPSDGGDRAVCPTCLRAARTCIDWRNENGLLTAGHTFSTGPGPVCTRCAWTAQPSQTPRTLHGVVRLELIEARCADCPSHYVADPTVPSTRIVRTLRDAGWAVITRRDEIARARCVACVVDRRCSDRGHDYSDWSPTPFTADEEFRTCLRGCRIAGANEYRELPSHEGGYLVAAIGGEQ